MKKLFIILSMLSVMTFSYAQQQITDFPVEKSEYGSFPSEFLEFNNLMFYVASSPGYGGEIWTLSGDQDKPVMLKDIFPGNKSAVSSSLTKTSVILNNKLYFVAKDGTSNGEIWCTDGTSEGTVKITHSQNYNISQLTLVGDHFYFVKRINNFLQVWISDGTENGTKMVKGGIQSASYTFHEGKCNNTFVFCFMPQYATETSLWRSDGTSEGTYALLSGFDGNGAGIGGTDISTQYIEFNNALYFVIRDYSIFGSGSSVGIMKTDGTVANTVPVKAIHDGSSRLINYDDVIAIDNKLYFSFFEVDYKRLFIWESDGTESGTKLIYDVSGSTYFSTSNLYSDGDHLIFCGKNENGGTSLIRMNLDDYSLDYIKELQGVIASPSFFLNPESTCRIRQINDGKIFITVPYMFAQYEGWISGLTESSTIRVPILDDNLDYISGDILLFKGKFYLCIYSAENGRELWVSDGKAEGTLLVEDIDNTIGGMFDTHLWDLGNKFVFIANDGIHGEELYVNNMGTENTVIDIRKGKEGSYPANMIKYKNSIYFTASDSTHGAELWKTDGTKEGTLMIKDMTDGRYSTHITNPVVFNDTLFFETYRDVSDYLCKLKDDNLFEIKGFGGGISSLFACQRHLFFIVGQYKDLWVSDGTSAGTVKLKEFDICRNFTQVNGKLYFTASERNAGDEELWSSDGTQSGTVMVKDIGMGYPSEPNQLINLNNKLFFSAYTQENGRELWQSEGSEGNTYQITDILQGPQSSLFNSELHKWNNNLYFSANDGLNGFELWKTDGSESGTRLVKDINSGSESSLPSLMASNENAVYFQAYDPEHGTELWKSDGTESGTTMVADIFPGVIGSSPAYILATSGDVFLFAETQNDGRQIWKIDPDGGQSGLGKISAMSTPVYPNPCKSFLNVPAGGRISKVRIYNSQGQVIADKEVVNNMVNVSDLSGGMYMLEYSINKQRAVSKFIKE